MNKAALLGGVSIGAIAVASGAFAADMAARPAYKAAPVITPAWSWNGFYVGAHIGGARARSSVETALPGEDFLGSSIDGPLRADGSGLIGGLQAGYNFQVSSIVLGLEGDVSFASIGRSTTVSPNAIAPTGDIYSSKLSMLSTIRGRIGFAFDRLLIFGTGGVAFANIKDQFVDFAFPFTDSPGTFLTGWTAGGGIEYAVTNNWTVKAEYLHVGFGNRTRTVNAVNDPYTFVYKDSIDLGRVGINYKF